MENNNVMEHDNATVNSKKGKDYSLKSVQVELEKLEKSRDKKEAKIKALTDALKADNKQIKELTAIYKRLQRESMAADIAKQLGDSLDGVPLDEIMKAIQKVREEKEAVSSSATNGSATSSTSAGMNTVNTTKE